MSVPISAAVARIADAAVVGSAIVQRIADAAEAETGTAPDLVPTVLEFVGDLASGVRQARYGSAKETSPS